MDRTHLLIIYDFSSWVYLDIFQNILLENIVMYCFLYSDCCIFDKIFKPRINKAIIIIIEKIIELYNVFTSINHTHSKQLFTGHLYDACTKTSGIVVIKIMTSAWCWNKNTLFDLLFAVVVRNWAGPLFLPWVCRTCSCLIRRKFGADLIWRC